jgi:hypothetical protein
VTYRCATCGKEHDDLPDLAFTWPDPYYGVPEAERPRRIKSTSDTCVIDEEDFFIRGVILMPIVQTGRQFGIGVWVSQKRENYHTYLQNYDTAAVGPFFGWLCNSIPFYQPDTWAMKTKAHLQGNNQRPLIELEPSDHPLYLDYSNGVTLARAWEIAHARHHPSSPDSAHMDSSRK